MIIPQKMTVSQLKKWYQKNWKQLNDLSFNISLSISGEIFNLKSSNDIKTLFTHSFLIR